MKQLYILPMRSELKSDKESSWPVAVYEAGERVNMCEMREATDEGYSDCDNATILFGTDDGNDPLFCARHFFFGIHGKEGQSELKAEDCEKCLDNFED